MSTILARAERMYRFELTGNRVEATRIRRSLMSHLLRVVRADRVKVPALLLLGDLYQRRANRMKCYRRVLKVMPREAEANAEIALLFAEAKDPRYAHHCDAALNYCRGHEVEDVVIYTVVEAAGTIGDDCRARRALRLGRRRFPASLLFDGAKTDTSRRRN